MCSIIIFKDGASERTHNVHSHVLNKECIRNVFTNEDSCDAEGTGILLNLF